MKMVADRQISAASLIPRLGGPLAGAMLGYHLDPHSRNGYSYGLVNGANIGEYLGDLMDRRDVGLATRDLAYKTGAGNLITTGMLNANLPLAGAAGAIGSKISAPLIFGQDLKLPRQKKLK